VNAVPPPPTNRYTWLVSLRCSQSPTSTRPLNTAGIVAVVVLTVTALVEVKSSGCMM
jgi:hypothetical protein